jgi:hypothetical protein
VREDVVVNKVHRRSRQSKIRRADHFCEQHLGQSG